ncbi:unnamed protein product [Ambrosiozyma monospora]|uniref:Unnamed protein product n=1 Tax=Ambrosiozyma monospora TaxID=43982 RepID=A0ACB5TLE8_AMBMO|nr:unnamed protein product [Ambrosiozyma monospora]
MLQVFPIVDAASKVVLKPHFFNYCQIRWATNTIGSHGSREVLDKLKIHLIKKNQFEKSTGSVNWIDFFKKDNLADKEKRIEQIKQAFLKFLSAKDVSTLHPNKLVAVLSEFQRITNTNNETQFNDYSDIIRSVNKYGTLEKPSIPSSVTQTTHDLSLLSEFNYCLKEVQVKKNKAEQIDQVQEIKKLIDCYLQLPEPRLKDVDRESIIKFSTVIRQNLDLQECFNIAGRVINDVQQSAASLSLKGINTWIDNLLAAPQNEVIPVLEFIKLVKTTLSQWKPELDIEIYNEILIFCLTRKELDEFSRQLAEIQEKQLKPNRDTITYMADYCAMTQNLNGFLNVFLDFVINGKANLSYSLGPEHWLISKNLLFPIQAHK